MRRLRPGPAAGIALGIAICSLAALARTVLSGRLAVTDRPTWFGPYVWCVFGLGMALASACYLLALRNPGVGLERRHLAAAFGIHLCAAVATPLTSNDAFMNLAYGKLVLAGSNPYFDAPARLRETDAVFARVDWPRAVSAWGPITTYASAWAAARHGVMEAWLWFKSLVLAASLAGLYLAYRHCEKLPGQEALRSFVAYGFNPLLAWELSGQAHNDALMVLPMVAFVGLAATRRDAAAAAMLALACAAKAAAAPVLALHLCALLGRSWRRCVVATAVAVAVLGACWLPFWEGARTLAGVGPLLLAGPAHLQNSLASLVRFAAQLTEADALLPGWLAASRLLIILSAAYWAQRSAATGRAMDAALCFLTLCLAVAIPYVHPWYGTWLLPLALGPISEDRRLGVAVYTAVVPALYLTRAAGALAILAVAFVGLLLLLSPERLAALFDGSRRTSSGARSD